MKIQYFQTTFIYLLWPKICLHDSTYVLPEFVSVASQSRHDLGFLGNLRGFGILSAICSSPTSTPSTTLSAKPRASPSFARDIRVRHLRKKAAVDIFNPILFSTAYDLRLIVLPPAGSQGAKCAACEDN